jgi:hypothetical protein
MSEGNKSQMVGRRSELLAQVALTASLDIDVHPFDVGGKNNIDLVCTIRPEVERGPQGFMPFGVLLSGTAKELKTGEDATKFAKSHWKLDPQKRVVYSIPVIALLFSMVNDAGYFAWVAEPEKESEHLLHRTDLDFSTFDKKQLDRLIIQIKKWYLKVYDTIVITDEAAYAKGNS